MNQKLFSILLIGFVSLSFSQKKIVYTVLEKEYQGYQSKFKKEAPSVILIHDWDGLTEYEVKRAEMLSQLGYNVFAIDLFGKGVRPTKIEEKKKLTGELYQDRKKMRTLLEGSLEAARRAGIDTRNIVVLGYCFGGTVGLELARMGKKLKGFGIFHGGLVTPVGQDYSLTKGKIMIFHGSADEMVSFEDFANLGKELEKAKVPHELIAYSGAPHAFSVIGSERYQKEADEASWRRFTQFLAETFKN